MSQHSSSEISDLLELIAEMSSAFAQSLDVDSTLSSGLARIVERIGAEAGSVFLLDGAELVCQDCVGPVNITGLRLDAGHGIVGRTVRLNKSTMVFDTAKDPDFKGAVDKKTGFVTRSIICSPLSVGDKRLGALQIVNKTSGDGLFGQRDGKAVEAMAASAALAILNARQARSLLEQERMKHELNLAAEIQRRLLPDPPTPDFPIAGHNQPARTVSGDFYDFVALPNGKIAFSLADVSGKGMNAALIMAKTASLFRCLAKEIPSPGRLLARINDELCETGGSGMFVTMVCGVYDPRSQMALLSNAGHEPPLVYDGAEFIDYPAEAPPVGIDPLIVGGEPFPEIEVALAERSLYIFTDGLTEAMRADGSQLGVEAVKEMIAGHAEKGTRARLASIIDELNAPGLTTRDDVTILVVDGRRTKE
jgi:sigma-B regulation protein RsbU (phosphoserine phosphatase)